MKKYLLALVLSTFFGLTAFTQEFKVSPEKFIRETQRSNSENHQIKLVWWMPVDFWPVVLAQSPNIDKNQVDQIVNVLKNYNIVAVVDGAIQQGGDIQYKTVDELSSTIYLMDNNGIKYVPLKEGEINSDTRTLISVLKPMIGNMMGKMGQNFQFFVFPAFTKDKVLIADPRKPGSLTIGMDGAAYAIKLPLESLLKPKKCPVDGAEMEGSWLFCPWHGVKLAE